MDIRLLKETDSSAYSELWRTALEEQDEFFRISIQDEPSPQIQTEFSKESFTLGAFINGDLLGTVSIQRNTQTKLNHKALLFRMFVHSSASGKGVGKALVNEAITQTKSIQGLRQINLTVLDVNPRAIHLYNSAGFKVFAHELESVKIQNEFIGELQMVLFVSTPNKQLKLTPATKSVASVGTLVPRAP